MAPNRPSVHTTTHASPAGAGADADAEHGGRSAAIFIRVHTHGDSGGRGRAHVLREGTREDKVQVQHCGASAGSTRVDARWARTCVTVSNSPSALSASLCTGAVSRARGPCRR